MCALQEQIVNIPCVFTVCQILCYVQHKSLLTPYRAHYYLYFENKTKVQNTKVTFPKQHSQHVARLDLIQGPSPQRAKTVRQEVQLAGCCTP